jgi:hypothetical protein
MKDLHKIRPVLFRMTMRALRPDGSVPVLTTQCNALSSTEAGSSHGQSSARHAALATASGPLLRRRANSRFSQRIGFRFIAGGPDDDYELVSATSQIYV